MNALYILSLLGIAAGSIGGAFTGGLDGTLLGGSAGFVLGVLAWLTDTMEQERQSRELLPEQLLSDINAFARLHPFDRSLARATHPDLSTDEQREPVFVNLFD